MSERRVVYDNKGGSVANGDCVAAEGGRGLPAVVSIDDELRVTVTYPRGGIFGPMDAKAFEKERWTKTDRQPVPA